MPHEGRGTHEKVPKIRTSKDPLPRGKKVPVQGRPPGEGVVIGTGYTPTAHPYKSPPGHREEGKAPPIRRKVRVPPPPRDEHVLGNLRPSGPLIRGKKAFGNPMPSGQGAGEKGAKTTTKQKNTYEVPGPRPKAVPGNPGFNEKLFDYLNRDLNPPLPRGKKPLGRPLPPPNTNPPIPHGTGKEAKSQPERPGKVPGTYIPWTIEEDEGRGPTGTKLPTSMAALRPVPPPPTPKPPRPKSPPPAPRGTKLTLKQQRLAALAARGYQGPKVKTKTAPKPR